MPGPRFSLVVPVYAVEAYLPAFLASLAAQTYPVADVNLVFVIDGSPDRSEEVVRAWAGREAPQARVLTQENAGLSAARNAGLAAARGTWVTFCDPDDVLDPGYLAAVAGYLDSAPEDEVDLVACYVLLLDDATGELVDRHPLRRRFKARAQLVDLTREPDRLHLQAASAFYRRERVLAQDLRFDGRIRPNFEDGAFTARYLWARPRPQVAFLPEARYGYRKRADGSSLVQSSWARPEKLSDLPRHGYRDLLRDLRAAHGRVPPWVQNVVLYELCGFLREDDRPYALTGSLDPALLAGFRDLLGEVVDLLDPWAVEAFRVVGSTHQIRLALELARTGAEPPPYVWVDRLDPDQQTIGLRYFYRGDPPAETLVSRGRAVEPVWGKHRRVDYFGATAYGERIAWVSATGTLAVELDGVRRPLRTGRPEEDPYRLGPTALWRELAGSVPPANASTRPARSAVPAAMSPPLPAPAPAPVPRVAGLAGRLRRLTARGPEAAPAPAEPRPLWLLDDGADTALLAGHLRRHHPETDVRVVSPAEAAGPGEDGLVAGSVEHLEALGRAAVLVLSRPDRAALLPPGATTDAPLVLLAGDVQPYDTSRLLDRLGLRLLVTAARCATDVLAADGTRSELTDREVLLAGSPRHDALLAAPAGPARRLLVAPAARRAAPGPDAGRVAASWCTLLEHPDLAALLDRAGLALTVLAEPDAYAGFAARLGPERVEAAATADRVGLLTETAVLLTDHGPAAFDAAVLRRPVLYLQPDPDDYLSGRHGVRPSGWTEADRGFGPVCRTPAEALRHLDALLGSRGAVLAEPYAARAAAELPLADGGSCERVVAAIARLGEPLTHAQAYRPVP